MIVKVLNLMFYIIYMFLLFLGATSKKVKNNMKVFKIFIFFMLIFIFFKEISLDYVSYKNMYTELNVTEKYEWFKNYLEPIPYFLMYLPKKLNLPHQFFFFNMGVIPLFINYFFIKKNSSNKLLSLFFLFCIHFFTAFGDAIRQNMAASFFLLVIYFYKNKKNLKATFFLILSFGSHYSTILILPIFLLSKIRWNIKKYICMFFTIFIFALFANVFFYYLSYLNFDNILFLKFKHYLFAYNLNYNYLNHLHFILHRALNFFPYFGVMFINLILLKRRSYSGIDKLILNFSIASSLICTAFIFVGAITLGTRVLITFSYGIYLLLLKENVKKGTILIIILYYVMFNFIYVLYYSGIQNPMSPFFIS